MASFKAGDEIWSPSLNYCQNVQAWWQYFVQHGQKFVRVNELNHTNFDILSFTSNPSWRSVGIGNLWMR
jgi:hypothetical protein